MRMLKISNRFQRYRESQDASASRVNCLILDTALLLALFCIIEWEEFREMSICLQEGKDFCGCLLILTIMF